MVVFADLRRFYHHPYCGKCEIKIAPFCNVLKNRALAVKSIYLLIFHFGVASEFVSNYSGLANMCSLEYWLAAWVPPIGLNLAI